MSTTTPAETLQNGQPFVREANRAALVEATAQREIAQIQASMVIAQRFPRNAVAARDHILMACGDPELAKVATYKYARGGQDISGPSIRLAEVMAQCWHNLDVGWAEIEQRPGESVAEAWCWDLETNSRQRRQFYVKHVRDTRKGRIVLQESRDIYERVANDAARRLRSCILAMIPRSVVDAAVSACEKTLETTVKLTPELLKDILGKFSEIGVSQAQIESFIQRRYQAIAPAQVVRLNGILNSIRDGMSTPADWFDPEEQPDGSSKTRTERLREELEQQKGGLATPAVSPKHEDAAADPAPASPSKRDIERARELRGALSRAWKDVDTAVYREVLEREYAKKTLTDLTVAQLEDFLERTPELIPQGAEA